MVLLRLVDMEVSFRLTQLCKAMLTPLHKSKVLLASSICCIPSSAIVPLAVFWYVKFYPSFISSVQGILFVLATGAFIGTFKSLLVGGFAFVVKPFLRWWVIIVSTIVLTLFEGWFYYDLWAWVFLSANSTEFLAESFTICPFMSVEWAESFGIDRLC